MRQGAAAQANFATESKLARLEADLADANAALRAARAGASSSASLAQEKMGVEQQLITQQLTNERLEAQVAAGARELEAAKIELLQAVSYTHLTLPTIYSV